ncbi:MAG: pyridoxine 5'-phosphate synthase [Cyanobacteria bacterium SIG30]|nr:pyridoxine 5'-phosphate synthase [Cyanobacteria bacterium SIG30]
MKLGVNIDHVATLRNARGGVEPSVLDAGIVSQNSGATAITVHLREDRRHIVDNDVIELKKALKININLEMAAVDEMRDFAIKLKPYSCCLVPERRQELTTEGGLNVVSQFEHIKNIVSDLKNAGIVVSLFIDPDLEQVKASYETGAQYIELHTGCFANASGEDQEKELERLKNAAIYAQELGLNVNAGHGLNYENVSRMKEIEGLCELNIGHSIISRAIFVGLDSAVSEMVELIA